MEQKSRAALMADALMGYAQKGGEGLMRGVRAANQALDVSQYLAPKDVAGFLPGAGFVQGAQDAQSARDEFSQGNYGRAAGYGAQSLLNTGLEMLPLTAALPAVSMMSRAADLPMDEASRMARATDQGFTVDAYHGSPRQFDAFDGAKAGSATDAGYLGRGIYASSDPAEASIYARDTGSVYPLKLRMERPLVLDERFDGRRSVDREVVVREALGLPPGATADDVTAALASAGHDGVVFNWKRFGESSEYMVPNPEQARSRFAAFDPAKKNSRDLLASMAAAFGIPPAALMAQALMQQGEEPI